ncbi:hypothetical protein G4H71_02810 [Rhodococcus triatomae]|uniref:PPE domain-containing protein n=1 Tax=Rhodococcus triatomae TaxID=300028 RepID=A0A1G8M110_9NOCA|nr:hypothetical protein [Rhodococcus triatomae]QNG18222.1 hypothetical protein G4H72_05230 [Rhodococcus triatomae]QNG22107.1 hypothetical protein G4H71_02810 [Rhodococcus triatomae]SDI61565.1 hypothetical protein SAMN05444695_10972 [Rhodococcus triatomae]
MAGAFDTENFRASRWDHASITDALRAVDPVEAERIATVWRTLGSRYDAAMAAFAASVDSAGAGGWSGPAADSVRSAVSRHVSDSLDASTGFATMSTAVSGVASAAESARASVGDPVPVPDDWTSVLPWNWSRPEEAAAAEQAARSTMESVFGPALTAAAQSTPDFAAPASVPDTSTRSAGFDVGPNGIHAVPSVSQASPESGAVLSAPADAPAPAPRSADAYGSALATGAIAGALGGGMAQYAGRVVAAHRAEATEQSADQAVDQLLFSDTEDALADDPDSVLETIDADSPLVGELPRVAPPVIGE